MADRFNKYFLLKTCAFLFFVLGVSSVLSPIQHARSDSIFHEKLTADPELEARLKVLTRYKIHRGDTLKRVARLLYGHETWWVKIRNENLVYSAFEPSRVLPEGAYLQYRIPLIGTTYIVSPNDWLIRIVQWKYGATSFWEEIYRKNISRISNPNLIKPGDVLTLGLDGSVLKARGGAVLVEGVVGTSGPGTVDFGNRDLKSQQNLTSNLQPISNSTLSGAIDRIKMSPVFIQTDSVLSFILIFVIGFILGTLLLGLLTLTWRLTHSYLSGSESSVNSIPPVGKTRFSIARIFRKQGIDEPQQYKDLIHRDVGSLERPPGYELISTRRKKVKNY